MPVKVKVDFNDIESGLPEGAYECIIEKIEYREPKEQGKYPYLNVTYQVAEGEHEGQHAWEVLSWSPRALFRMRDFFEKFGIEGVEHDLEIDEDSGLLLNPDLSGVPVAIVIEHEIVGKQKQSRVVDVEPSGEVPEYDTTPEDDDEDEDEEDDEEASDESEDDEDEEEEEEAPAPKKVAKKAPKAAPKAAPKKKAVTAPVGKKRVLR